jgi:hypothetical protein
MLRLLFIVAPILATTNAFAAGDDKASTGPILVAVVTAVFGFLGSWLGASFALQSFKRQRAFDKQLDWYERAAQAIFRLAETIQVADTYQDEKGTPPTQLKKRWQEVQSAHLQILRVAHDARLFASKNAVAQMNRIVKHVQKVADLTEAFDPPKIKDDENREDLLWKIYNLSEFLENSAPPLLAEGRAHLGIDQKPIFPTSKRRLFRLARYRARKLQTYFFTSKRRLIRLARYRVRKLQAHSKALAFKWKQSRP